MSTQIQVFDQLKRVTSGMNKKQRAVLIGGAVLTLLTLLIFVKIIGKRDFKPLFTDLEQQDAQKISAQLGSKQIPFEISADGKTLSVPADQLDSARIEVASSGMPHSGRLGFELFDKVSWGQTEFDEQVNYQRAMEGELERTIQTLSDVQSARVHLVMTKESVFISRERPAKASVIIKTKHGELSEQSEMAISRLVAGAVDNLSMDNVTVTDADTNRPLRHKAKGWIADEDQERLLLSRLMATLDPVLGQDHVRATVDVEYDPSTVEESQDIYDPASQVAVSKQTSEEQIGSSSGIGGVPGTASNIPGSKTTAQADPSNDVHVAKTDNQSFAVNRINRHTSQPAGRIRRITAAVVVDDIVEPIAGAGQTPKRRRWTPEELTKIEQLAQASLGIDAKRGDLVTIQNVAFDRPAPSAPVKLNPVQRVSSTLRDFPSVVRMAAILFLFLIVYLFVLRPVQKQVVQTFKALIPEPEPEKVLAVPTSAEPPPAGLANGLFSEEKQALRKELIEKVKNDVVPTSRMIQSWLEEDA